MKDIVPSQILPIQLTKTTQTTTYLTLLLQCLPVLRLRLLL